VTEIDVELDRASSFTANNRGDESNAIAGHCWGPVKVQYNLVRNRRSFGCEVADGEPVENRISGGWVWHAYELRSSAMTSANL
jgi:hypothetical protein